MVMAHHQLRVDQNVPTEDHSTANTIDELDRAVIREENVNESGEDEDPQCTEEVRHPGRKVVFGLAGEESEGKENAECKHKCLEHNLRIIEGYDNRDSVGFKCGEAAQEDEVRGVGFAFPEGQDHKAESPKKRRPHRPSVILDPCLITSAEVRGGAEGNGGEKLDGPSELSASLCASVDRSEVLTRLNRPSE